MVITKMTVGAERLGMRRTTIERMDEIVRVLKECPFLNGAQLAEKLGVSVKSIQRDIRFIQTRKRLPLVYDAKRRGYHFTGPVPGVDGGTLQLSPRELVALCIARKAMEPLMGTRLQRLVEGSIGKIVHACPELAVSVHLHELNEALSIQAPGALEADEALFKPLVEAVMNCQEVVFDYHKLEGVQCERRQVQPYHVASLSQGWYLVGLDVDRKAWRQFALQRMKNLEPVMKRFHRDETFDLKRHLQGGFGVWMYDADGGGEHEVCVRFEGYAARCVKEREWHPTQEIVELEASCGAIEFRARLAGLEEITRWILGWGSLARVVGPLELKERVRTEVKKMGVAAE